MRGVLGAWFCADNLARREANGLIFEVNTRCEYIGSRLDTLSTSNILKLVERS